MTHLSPSDERIIDSLNSSVLRLLRNNRATLEELELHSSVWRIQELQTLTFPALKALTVSVDNLSDGNTLGQFLKNQKSLEELTLTSKRFFCGDPVYTGIKERSVVLKKLHITALTLDEMDWSFLALMNRLKDFRLEMRGGFHKGNIVLDSLPKNQLESLSLEGIWNTWGRPSGFWGLGPLKIPEFGYKPEVLQGFRCLRKLSFLGTWDAVDDELMQRLLKEFVLKDCSTLSDAGISGKTTAEWGRDASFADLRRLKTLKILRCRGVTTNGVLASCVNVPSLKSLEYTNPPGSIEESVVLQLVEQNPKLERLSLHYYGNLEKLMGKLLKKDRRVELLLAEEDNDW